MCSREVLDPVFTLKLKLGYKVFRKVTSLFVGKKKFFSPSIIKVLYREINTLTTVQMESILHLL